MVNEESKLYIARDEDVAHAANILNILSNPMRFKILCALMNREVSVSNVLYLVGTTQSNVSRHLSVLKLHKLVSSRREMNGTLYRICDPQVIELVDFIQKLFVADVKDKPKEEFKIGF